MTARVLRLVAVASALAVFAACDKVNNPARPSVSFAAPTPQTPNGTIYTFSQQPLTLEIVNSATTGKATVTYNVEVSNNSGFASIAFSQDGIAEGSGGITTVTLPALAGNTTYYWHWRAVIDGIVGEPSTTQSFFVKPSLTINAPALQTPTSGTVFQPRPTFTVTNATRVGPSDVSVLYDFQIANSAAFTTLVASTTIPEQSASTSWTPSIDLPEATLFWRVRGREESLGSTGAFSSIAQFDRANMTINAPTLQSPAANSTSFVARPTFTLVNSTRTGPANTTLTYDFEVSNSSTFTTLLASASITEGANGTSWTPGSDLPEGALFWRARGKQTTFGVTGPYANAVSFTHTNISINQPTLQQPDNNSDVFSARPTFTVSNANRTAPSGTVISYEFQVSTSAAFSTLVATATVQETSTSTSWTPSVDLPIATLFWRVRGVQPAFGVTGPFSNTGTFNRKFGIDIDKVVWSGGPNASKWPETGRITSSSKNGDQICVGFEANWPTAPWIFDSSVEVVATQWVFVNIGGTWHAGAGHWYKVGQFCKGEYDENFFVDGWGPSTPLHDVVLHTGDVFGMMISTPARGWPDGKTLDERTNIILMVW